MKHWMDLGVGRKRQSIGNLSNALEDLIESIEFWHELLVVFIFERGFLIRLKEKNHLILFYKRILE